MKATKQYFLEVLFIMLSRVVLTSESMDQILKFYHLNELNVIKRYFLAVLFI